MYAYTSLTPLICTKSPPLHPRAYTQPRRLLIVPSATHGTDGADFSVSGIKFKMGIHQRDGKTIIRAR